MTTENSFCIAVYYNDKLIQACTVEPVEVRKQTLHIARHLIKKKEFQEVLGVYNDEITAEEVCRKKIAQLLDI